MKKKAGPYSEYQSSSLWCHMQAGQGLLLAALEHISTVPAADAATSRIGVLYNPTDQAKEASLLAKLLLVVLDLPSRRPKIPGERTGFQTSVLCMPQE